MSVGIGRRDAAFYASCARSVKALSVAALIKGPTGVYGVERKWTSASIVTAVGSDCITCCDWREVYLAGISGQAS
ncbi:hypothetical protein J6590_075102 [Homalodisca vitripennis]|nr:hypothetical protein J6590_075102 [Homalodisca vitripennis]